ncbi:MAG: type II 3-dehydroquinate dehydratase [Gemmatimonadaceae bacterium]
MRIAVLNGPNLNLLGSREPTIYGTDTLADVEKQLREVGREIGAELSFAQENGEGALIDRIHALRGVADGAIINAGAYSHTSLALYDAFASIALPYVEVHVSNIFAREPERRHSTLAAGAVALLAGFGAYGYELALRGLVAKLSSRR